MRCYKCMKEISDSQVCPYCGYDLSSEQENKQYLPQGTGLGEIYTIGTVIGAGGFGVTYIGWDNSLNRTVAIKEYFPSSLSTRIPGQTAISAFSGEKQQIFNHGKERFMEEAYILMKFTGEEGIVSVYDVIEANGTVYMVMEYVEGETLKKSIEDHGPVSEEKLLNFIVPMLLSLKYVHNAGYTHRDISPDNIICKPDGSVKLLDFGAARYSVMEESKSLSVIIKQGYTPVEQYQSHGKQGAYTDIYAVGATMYKALTGITPDESLERMVKETLKKPSQCGVHVSENTENAVMAALNIRAEDRPQTIDEFLSILTGEKKGVIIAPKRPKKGLIIAIVAALVVAIGAGTMVWSFINGKTTDPVDEIGDDGKIEVPNATNKTESDAEKLLSDNQLNMIVSGGLLYDAEMIEQGYIEENIVVKQDPVAGTSVDPNSDVGVILSKGKKKEYVPSVTDKLLETAVNDFEKNGFGDNFEINIEEKYSDTNMTGTVISQDISEDTAVDFDGKITLTISLGRKDPLDSTSTITVDNYVGESFDKIKQELLKDNIYLVKSASIYSSEYPYGTIIFQSPDPGSEMRSGGAVYVITSLGVEKTRVPDLRYLPIEEAKELLMESGLSWKIKYVVDGSVSAGLVVEQKTDPGVKTPFGTEIELYVSAEQESEENTDNIEIKIDPETLQLSVNESVALSCSYSGKVMWSSSNSHIAEVSEDGVVTGKQFGSVVISAAVDGNIATATVTVTDDSIITSIEDYILDVGDVVSLSSDIPDSILDQVVWKSSNSDVASVDDKGTVTALSEGYTSITATYKDQTVKCGITVKGKVKYIKILKELLSGKVSAAESVLEANGISYEIEEEYSDTVAEGNVAKIKYVGYSDNDSFYITEGSKVTLKTSLGKNSVQSVSVKTPPQKTEYYVGEKPDYTGLVLTVKYKDGTTKDISKGYEASSSALKTAGSQKIKVTYENQSTTVTLTAKNKNVVVPQNYSFSIVPDFCDEDYGYWTYTIDTDIPDFDLKKVTWSVETDYLPHEILDDGRFYHDWGGSFKLTATYTYNGKTYSDTYEEIYEISEFSIECLSHDFGYDRDEAVYYIESDYWVIGGEHYDFDVLTWSITPNEYNKYIEGGWGDVIVDESWMKPGDSYTITATYHVIDGTEVTASYTYTMEAEETNYSFKIVSEHVTIGNGDRSWFNNIETDIPNFDLTKVKWDLEYLEYKGDVGVINTGEYYVGVECGSYTLTAEYTYNGKTYSDTYEYTPPDTGNYSFKIVAERVDPVDIVDGILHSIETNIPNFDLKKVQWNLERLEFVGFDSGVLYDGSYYLEDYGSYILYAEYIYNGKTYSDTYKKFNDLSKYDFEIVREDYGYDTVSYTLETNYGSWFMGGYVNWNVPVSDKYILSATKGTPEIEVDESWMKPGDSYTITATYNYLDETMVTVKYTYTKKAETNYSFDIVSEAAIGAADTRLFKIKTNIPDFDYNKVEWSTDAEWYDICNVVDEPEETGIICQSNESYTTTASYVYNGKTYSDKCTTTIYSFSIVGDYYDPYCKYSINTDVPNFDYKHIWWELESLEYTEESWKDDNGYFWVNFDCGSYILTCGYYDGEIYCGDTYEKYNDLSEYDFNIVRRDVDGSRDAVIYTLETNYSYFMGSNVQWSISVSDEYILSAKKGTPEIEVDESWMKSGDSYTIAAFYCYSGQTMVTARFTFSIKSSGTSSVKPTLPTVMCTSALDSEENYILRCKN